MRFTKLALALGAAAAFTGATIPAAQAVEATFTADYRHEYRSEWGQNYDRICLIGALDNGVGFYVDSSFKSGTESTSETTGYKPYLRLQYNTSFGLWFAIRPRYDYWRYDDERADQKNARIDAWIGYNRGNFGINYNYTHMWALNDNADGSERVMWDGKDWNYEQNIAINYRLGKWNPYIEFGDIGVNGTDEDRQLRLRVGIQYTF